MRDHTLFEPYKTLLALYQEDAAAIGQGDFSERMTRVVARITDTFQRRRDAGESLDLSANEVTNLVYTHDIPRLRDHLSAYLENKGSVWILFDNIDKGWPTHGVGAIDILLLRALLDATRRIERYLQKGNVDIHAVVFLRNDVFELLVDESSDRGKESQVSLDWTDADQLKELLRRRFIFNGVDEDEAFEQTWNQLCVSHIEGQHTADYLIERSLMRPRNFLNLVNYCKGYAVNLNHGRISQEDIAKAVRQYSADIGNEIGLEIRDVFPEAADILYSFIGASSSLTLGEIYQLLELANVAPDRWERLTEILLWFSFLGVHGSGAEPVFIYNVYYDMKKLKKLARDLRDPSLQLGIHRAFWPFLEIADR